MIGTPWHNVVPVKVIESTQVASGRWQYVVQVVEFGSSVQDVPDVPTIPAGGPKQLIAYNMYEYANTSSSHMGVNPTSLIGTYALQPIPTGSIVPAFIANGRAADANATNGVMVMLLWPNQIDGACEEEPQPSTGSLVQSFTGTWTGQFQYEGTETINIKQVVDLTIGAERWGPNSIRFWNGSEALNAGATVSASRNQFATSAECRAWWDLFVVRVNMNNEGWQYVNAANAGNVTVDGSAQPAYVNTQPAVSWSGSDFYAGLPMDVEIYELSLGGGP